MKFKVSQKCDYVMGHLRYGHLEGVVDVKDEEELKGLIESDEITDYMEFRVDDYEIEECDTGCNKIEYQLMEK
jgi:hypothetical protein